MNKNKEFTSLLREIPILTQDAEGHLRGGFAVMALGDDDVSDNNGVCYNNKVCIGNMKCSGNGTCIGPTGTK